jgi:hypothetical protein
MAIIAIAEGEPVALLAHLAFSAKTEAVLDEGVGSPSGARDANSPLITLVAVISDPERIALGRDEDFQAMGS